MTTRLDQEIRLIVDELGFAARDEVVEHLRQNREAVGRRISVGAARLAFDSLVRNASRESGSRESICTLWVGRLVLLIRDAKTRSRLFDLYRQILTIDPATDRRLDVDRLIQNASVIDLDKLIPRERVIAFISTCACRRPSIPSPSSPMAKPSSDDRAPFQSSNTSPFVLSDSLHELNEREIDVFSRRFSDQPETLESIGRDWGVTRERIRQIQKEAHRRLVRSLLYRDLERLFIGFLRQFGYLSKEIAIRLAIDSVDQVPEELLIAAARVVLDSLESKNEVQALVFESVLVRDNIVEKAVNDLVEIAARCVEPDLSIERDVVVRAAINDHRFEPVEDWVRRALTELWEQISTAATGKRRLSYSQATAPALSERVLQEAGRPLHFSEVAAGVSSIRRDQGMEPLSENTVHNALGEHKERFAYAGQGTYGLRVWGDDVPYIRDAIEITLKTAGRPLTHNEILHEVKKVRPADSFKDSSISMYLGMNDRFYESRSRKFGVREWLDPHPTLKTSRDYVETPTSARRLSKSD